MKKRFFLAASVLSLLYVPFAGIGQTSAPTQPSATAPQLTENNYKVYSVKQKKLVTLDDIVQDMKNYDILFFGEEHNDSVGHYLEKTLFEKMYGTYGSSLALSLEMFDRDVQTVLNEYLQGFIREKNFTKDARVWSNYRDYRPMVEFAKEKKLDVIAANAPGRYTNLAGRKGISELMKLSDAAKNYMAPLPYDTATGDYYNKFMGLSHASPVAAKKDSGAVADTAKKAPAMPPMMGSFNMNYGQSLWDATMAYSIKQYHDKFPKKKIMQVNGKFHSDEYFGIVAQLKKYKLKEKSLVVSAFPESEFPNTKYEDYKGVADYLLVTDPNVPKTFDN